MTKLRTMKQNKKAEEETEENRVFRQPTHRFIIFCIIWVLIYGFNFNQGENNFYVSSQRRQFHLGFNFWFSVSATVSISASCLSFCYGSTEVEVAVSDDYSENGCKAYCSMCL